MKQLTVITFILLTLMTAKAQPLHRDKGDENMHTTTAGSMNKNGSTEKFSDANALTIYPNPATRNLYVELNVEAAAHATLKVINFIGKNIVTEGIDLVEGSNKVTIELSELESGIYFLKIEDGNAMHLVQRFTKH